MIHLDCTLSPDSPRPDPHAHSRALALTFATLSVYGEPYSRTDPVARDLALHMLPALSACEGMWEVWRCWAALFYDLSLHGEYSGDALVERLAPRFHDALLAVQAVRS